MNLKLVEYGEAVDLSSLSNLEVQRLSTIWKNRLGLQDLPFKLSISGDKEQIRALDVAGFINIDGVDIEIKPKFLQDTTRDEEWRKLLWNILALTENYSNNIFGVAGVERANENTSFLDVMGWTFLNSIRESLAEGMPRGYVEREGFFSDIRGSIDYTKINSILEKPFLFPCKYDEYNEDIPINRLLKWAGNFLSEKVHSFGLSHMIRDSSSLINTCPIPPGPIEADNIVLPIQFSQLQTALSIAKMLLRQEDLSHNNNKDLKSFGFLWKSHKVYEDFLKKILAISIKYINSNYSLVSQSSILIGNKHFNATENLFEKPDFKIKSGEDIIYILDAKYKLGNNPKPEDLNQVIVACQVEKCLHGILLFPNSNGVDTYHKTWKINSNGYPKYVSGIYLNLENMSVLRGEYKLAREVSEELKKIISYK